MTLIRASVLCCALTLTSAALAQGLNNGKGKVADRFAELCANCHGKNLEGGQAPSLLKDAWLHGGDDESIAHSIRTGFPDKGMPPWGQLLPEKEIGAMVIFIREMRAKFQREHTVFAKPAESITVKSQLESFQLHTWVGGLRQPWGLAFLPDGRAVVTEKSGKLRLIENGKLVANEIAGVPVVDTKQQAGLFDVVPHPDYAKNGWLYLAFADPQTYEGREVSMTRIIRGKLRNGALVEQQTIYQAPLKLYQKAGGIQFGSRIAFDRAGYLYFTIGDRGDGPSAQRLDRPTGKVHRVFDDGRIPNDNPFAHDPTAVRSIWSYGHRNQQGLAFHPITGELYAAEHGPRGGDEINHIRRGLNYGWPVITYGMNYDGTAMVDITAKEGMEQPVTHWTPSIAPCGCSFYSGDLFPKWKNNLFVASLAAEELHRLEIVGDKVIAEEILFKNLGRMRAVIGGPDGALYVLLPERIARITPAP